MLEAGQGSGRWLPRSGGPGRLVSAVVALCCLVLPVAAAEIATTRRGPETGGAHSAAEVQAPRAVLPAGTRPYLVAMHLHGHSNHNASVPGGHVASMQWHAAQGALHAEEAVLWWSDHVAMFDQSTPFAMHLDRKGREVLVRADLGVVGMWTEGMGRKVEVTHLEASHEGGTPTVRLEDRQLFVGLAGEPGEEWSLFAHEVKSNVANGWVHGFGFARPVSSGAVLEVGLECDSPGPDAACEIEVALAWHHEGQPFQHRLRYRIDSEIERRAVSVESPGEVLILLPPRADDLYRLDLLADAARLTNGDDNTINRLSLGLRARRGAEAAMRFRGFRLTSSQPQKRHQLEVVQRLAGRYQEAYDQVHHIGLEHQDTVSHVNAYFPAPLGPQDSALLDRDLGHSLSRWVRTVQELGGLISLNHPFLKRPAICGEEATDRACGVAVLRQLLENRAQKAQLLEVGYLDRGMDLRGHLDLWDRLTANGLGLYGIGVTDSHGGEWAAQRNPMTTWTLASSPEAPELLAALSRGRAFFGNPLMWDGVFAFRVGEAFMGDRVPSPGEAQPLVFELEPWPDDYRVFLVQGLIQPGSDVEYVHRRTPLERGGEIRIDTSRPSFVRLEAWQAAAGRRTPVAFTNPVVFGPSSAGG